MNLSAIDKVTHNKTRTNGMGDFAELQLSKVHPNPDQPRKEFETVALMELGHDIKDNGLLQPIVVVKRGDGYTIVSGERRYRAHKEWTDMTTIKAHIISVDDDKVLELALIENIQREDLTDFEIAVHIGKLQASGNYECKRDLAKAIGKSQSYLSKAFGCLRLDESIVKDLEEAKHDIGLSVLEEISRVKDKPMQREVYRMYLTKFITRDGIAEYRDLKMTSDEVPEVQAKAKDKDKRVDELLKEIEELKNKELYIIGYQHKKGVPHGGGHRLRATNRDEALELGRKHYHEEAKDKKYLFEAVTLKENSDFCDNFGKVKKKKWIINERDVSGNEEDGNSWYTTDCYFQYWELNIPNDFPKVTTTQRYKITIEEI